MPVNAHLASTSPSTLIKRIGILYGDLYRILSSKVCIANQTKSDWNAQIKKYSNFNITAILKCYCRKPKLPKKSMNCKNIWYVYRKFICQIYVKGNLVANESWWNIWDEVKINALKGGGECKQKGNKYIILSPSNSYNNKWLVQNKKIYPNVHLHHLP